MSDYQPTDADQADMQAVFAITDFNALLRKYDEADALYKRAIEENLELLQEAQAEVSKLLKHFGNGE